MDFITGLPKHEGKSVIMVIVDIFTKYTHFCAVSHPFKASIISMYNFYRIHGDISKITWKPKDYCK
jgi:hypothetical protein